MSELKLQQSRLDGRYDIFECLGRGSYAEIYVASDNAAPEGAPHTIVIKAPNLYLQDAPDAELERTLVANFQNEGVALDRVRADLLHSDGERDQVRLSPFVNWQTTSAPTPRRAGV